jgi:hypothetical protein
MASKPLAVAACLIYFGASAASAAPGDQIGSAVSVVNLVTAALEEDTRRLAAGDGVRQDEVIAVGRDARGEIQLNDDTKLALGPGSRLVLDKFVYDPDRTANAIILNMVRGTFRFITGVARKPSYVIRTPNASITVRGTIFDAYVQESGESWLLLHEGGIEACNGRGECRLLDEPGTLLFVSAEGEISNPVRWASLGGLDPSIFDQAFPFVGGTPAIDPDPVFTREELLEGIKTESASPPRQRRAAAPIRQTAPRIETRREKPATKAASRSSRGKTAAVDVPTREPRKVITPKPRLSVVSPAPRSRGKVVVDHDERPDRRGKYSEAGKGDSGKKRSGESARRILRAAAVGALVLGVSRIGSGGNRATPGGGGMGKGKLRGYGYGD